MSSDEFASPLRIYHSTKDRNGDRRTVRLYLPNELVTEMERHVKGSSLPYLSLHQYMLNCLHYGQEELAKHGLAHDNPQFQHELEAEDLIARLDATENLIEKCKVAWRKAETPNQKAVVAAQVREIASKQTDNEIAGRLRRILE